MAKNLVIVESPAKAKTIKKFLGPNYKIEASMGHVRDLPKSQLGIDIENDFEPKYITIRGKGELLAKLRKEVKKATKVYLATDPDREGEAISWHLLHSLKLEDKNTFRITFNEITQNAVKDSIKNAREIDMNLVDAQQARRLLDRVVGYKMSPVLWKKVRKGLSAGRVQSITLKLICDREHEINDFIPEEYWSLDAKLEIKETQDIFTAKFYGTLDEKVELKNEQQVKDILEDLKGKSFKISKILEKERKKKTVLPFTTSTLQQEASKKLNFTAIKTMRIAQQLYEGVEVKDEGTIGLITYLRTDSTRISEEAHNNVIEYIMNHYGEAYANSAQSQEKKKEGVQDAHEAIRPSYVHLSPDEIKSSLSRDQYKLYNLIWRRFVSSRMMPAINIIKSVKIDAGNYRFTTALSTQLFDGFLKVYKEDEENEDKQSISKLNDTSKLKKLEMLDEQHFTQHPPRYTEASLVKTLEENGVGRPSTYAPTIATVMARGYVSKENKQLFPSELGEIVNEMISSYFDGVIDVTFTASMEKQLDDVEIGAMEWKDVLRNFFPNFEKKVKIAEEEIEKIELKDEETDILCEKCGRNMVIKMGRYGKFLACPGFPDCRNAKPILEKVEDVLCHKCGGEILVKKTKKGRRYYGCEHNPECDFMTWNLPTTIKCDKCSAIMVDKGKKLMCSNDECKNVVSKEENVEIVN
jgi:DNA topoisomerase-1